MLESVPSESSPLAGNASDPLVAVVVDMYREGLKPETPNPAHLYEVTPLRAALARTYRTQACMVMYVVPGWTKQPRINKPGFHLWREEAPRMQCFACDIDNPGHALWTEEGFVAAREQDRSLPSLATAGVYYTPSGRRILQPLTRSLPVPDAEAYLGEWLDRLRADDLLVDQSCRDWPRHFRLPHTRRPIGPERRWTNARSRCVDLERMVAIEPPPLRTPLVASSARPSKRERRLLERVPTIATHVDDRWSRAIAIVARAIASVGSEWHTLFLAVSGALLRKGVPASELPAIVGAISRATGGDDRAADRERGARTTLERAAGGQPFNAYGTLRARWATVADAIDEAFLVGIPASTPPDPVATSPVHAPVDAPSPTLAEITAALERVIDNAPPGLTLVQAECGLGKSQAALRVMAKRAAKPHADPSSLGARAPTGSKSAMAVDKHALAIQCVAGLVDLETPAVRFFGPLSLKDASGAPVCQFADVAGPLVAGGQRMQWELCERRAGDEKCPHYDGCRAREGVEGPASARVAVGPHALVGALDAHAGKSGLLVIDEVQDFLETIVVTRAQLDETIAHAGSYFDGRYVGAMMPALLALRAFIAAGPDDAPSAAMDAAAAVRLHQPDVATSVMEQARRSAAVDGDIVDCACAAPFPERHHGTAPPILQRSIVTLLRYRDRAPRVGAMSLVLRTAHRALASDYPISIRAELRGRDRVLLVTAPREGLVDALRRDGPVVVLDANADLHAPILARIVGYEPPMHAFKARDGAPIARALFRTSHANQKAWSEGGSFAPTEHLVACVKTAFAWAAEDADTRTLAIIAPRNLELALRHAAGDDRTAVRAQWKDAGLSAARLDEFDAALGPIVGAWKGTLRFAHYGATRGLNGMADADALVRIGDPWRSFGDIENDVAFLQLGSVQARNDALCRAELEQAHGRLRTVHRTRPGRALHVGRVLPGGSGWTLETVEVREAKPGPKRRAPAMTADEFATIVATAPSVSAVARAVGRERATVRDYLTGKSQIPIDVAERARSLVRQGWRKSPY